MSGIRVVIAEDQTMVLGALAALLELNADIKVVAQAGDGQLALRAVQESRPDVLITDIEMPNMTGLELAKHLKLAEVAMPARCLRPSRRRPSCWEIVRVLKKPMDGDDVLDLLEATMTSR